MTVATTTDARWFRELTPDRGDLPLLLCLPYAGGGASIFRTWPDLFADHFHVVAVQLPGRETRVQESPEFDVPAVAEAILGRVGTRPYALFGHSMGGRLGFEVTHHLAQTGGPLPRLLALSATRPPHTVPDGPLDQISQLSDARLVARLRRSGSVPDAVLDEPELLALFLPVLRADFTWIDHIAPTGLDPTTAPRPVDVPLVSLAGTFDEIATFDQVGEWDRWTTAGHDGRVLPGGHFFLDEQPDVVRDIIAAAWTKSAGATAPVEKPQTRTPRAVATHHVDVGGVRLWRDGMLRTTMLPAGELDRLVDSDLARLADRAVGDGPDAEDARAEVERRLAEPDAAVAAVCADPRLREALAWQNPNLLGNVDKLAAGQSRRASRRRYREATVARYWQRYGAKNENIGFFGPTTWITLDPTRAATTALAGPELTRERRTFLEPWAVAALADALLEPWDARRHLVPERSPLVRFDLEAGQAAHLPRPPVRLTPSEIRVLDLVDGERTAQAVVAGSNLDPAVAQSTLAALHAAAWLRWDADIPPTPAAERALTDLLKRLPDEPAIDRARDGWARVLDARDRLAAAAGDAEAVIAAAAELDRVFGEIAAQETVRRPGEMYAGRRIYYEDTRRDLEVVIGADLLEPLAAVLEPLVGAARWLCAELTESYEQAFDELLDELADGAGEVEFAELWFLARGLLFGAGDRPVDVVATVFAQRWAQVLDLTDDAGSEVVLDPADFGTRVAACFPARSCDWSAARIHSPDIQVVASSLEELQRGEAQLVLGELHTAWATLDVAALNIFHPDEDRLAHALAHDCGERRVRLALPATWPRAGTRTTQVLRGEQDIDLVFEERPGVPRDRRLGIEQLVVRRHGGLWRVYPRKPHARAPRDGWPLVEVFSDLLAVHAVDAFKLLSPRAYTPRIRVGSTVLHRRTWRMSVSETGMTSGKGIAASLLAARRLRERLGLPEQVYVAIHGETKPVYCDLRSRSYVQAVGTMLRAAANGGGLDAQVTISEALPSPGQAWVPTGDGQTCLSEIRLQVVDEVLDA